MADDKAPTLRIKGTNIKPDTLGEVAWGMMQEYCENVGVNALDTTTGGDPKITVAAFGTVIEGMIITGGAKLELSGIEMLGLLENVKLSISHQMHNRRDHALYKRASAAVRKQKERPDAAVTS